MKLPWEMDEGLGTWNHYSRTARFSHLPTSAHQPRAVRYTLRRWDPLFHVFCYDGHMFEPGFSDSGGLTTYRNARKEAFDAYFKAHCERMVPLMQRVTEAHRELAAALKPAN